MQLTRPQQHALAIYRWYHTHPPSMRFYMSSMLWRSAWRIYGGVLMIAILVVISRSLPLGWLAYLLIGFFAGILISNILQYYRTIQLWPLLDAIIDWETAETLAQPPAPTPADPPRSS